MLWIEDYDEDDLNFDPNRINRCCGSDTTKTHTVTTTVTGLRPGTHNINIELEVESNDGTDEDDCAEDFDVTVSAPPPWWQVINGSVISRGNIISRIPTASGSSTFGCIPPVCNPYLITYTPGNTEGIAVYGPGSSYDFASDDTRGRVSQKGWLAQTAVSSQPYNYQTALSLVGSDVTWQPPSNNLDAGTPGSDGVIWYSAPNGFTISSAQTIAKRVVLFVDGNININSPIRVPNKHSGFFMVIARGNINIGSNVGGSVVGTADLEGIYLANGTLNTNSGTLPLQFRGSVAALGGYNLRRDLQGGNANRPAESFRYEPAFLLNYPKRLIKDKFIWREVAP